jgi:HAD superfamily hydrolase (TIGR01509 family)
MTSYGVIFDMDGVLIDSLPIIHQVFNELLEEKHGIRIEPEDMVKWNGKKLKDIIDEWNQAFGVSIDFDTFRKEADHRECELLRENPAVPDSLLPFIATLKENDVLFGIGTSSTKGRVLSFLDICDLAKEFSVVITADDVTHGKPNPELFLTVASRLGIAPEKCVVIEDAPNGIEAAKRGGMKAIGVLSAWHTPEELGKADLLIKDFSELDAALLEGLFQ